MKHLTAIVAVLIAVTAFFPDVIGEEDKNDVESSSLHANLTLSPVDAAEVTVIPSSRKGRGGILSGGKSIVVIPAGGGGGEGVSCLGFELI